MQKLSKILNTAILTTTIFTFSFQSLAFSCPIDINSLRKLALDESATAARQAAYAKDAKPLVPAPDSPPTKTAKTALLVAPEGYVLRETMRSELVTSGYKTIVIDSASEAVDRLLDDIEPTVVIVHQDAGSQVAAEEGLAHSAVELGIPVILMAGQKQAAGLYESLPEKVCLMAIPSAQHELWGVLEMADRMVIGTKTALVVVPKSYDLLEALTDSLKGGGYDVTVVNTEYDVAGVLSSGPRPDVVIVHYEVDGATDEDGILERRVMHNTPAILMRSYRAIPREEDLRAAGVRIIYEPEYPSQRDQLVKIVDAATTPNLDALTYPNSFGEQTVYGLYAERDVSLCHGMVVIKKGITVDTAQARRTLPGALTRLIDEKEFPVFIHAHEWGHKVFNRLKEFIDISDSPDSSEMFATLFAWAALDKPFGLIPSEHDMIDAVLNRFGFNNPPVNLTNATLTQSTAFQELIAGLFETNHIRYDDLFVMLHRAGIVDVNREGRNTFVEDLTFEEHGSHAKDLRLALSQAINSGQLRPMQEPHAIFSAGVPVDEHRGIGGINGRVADCLYASLDTFIAQGRLLRDDPNVDLFREAYTRLRPGYDVLKEAHIDITGLVDDRLSGGMTADNGTALRVAALPVAELARTQNGESITSHLSLEEGIGWLAVGRPERPRSNAEIELDRLYMLESYNVVTDPKEIEKIDGHDNVSISGVDTKKRASLLDHENKVKLDTMVTWRDLGSPAAQRFFHYAHKEAFRRATVRCARIAKGADADEFRALYGPEPYGRGGRIYETARRSFEGAIIPDPKAVFSQRGIAQAAVWSDEKLAAFAWPRPEDVTPDKRIVIGISGGEAPGVNSYFARFAMQLAPLGYSIEIQRAGLKTLIGSKEAFNTNRIWIDQAMALEILGMPGADQLTSRVKLNEQTTETVIDNLSGYCNTYIQVGGGQHMEEAKKIAEKAEERGVEDFVVIALPKTIDWDTNGVYPVGAHSAVRSAHKLAIRSAPLPGSNQCVLVQAMGRLNGSLTVGTANMRPRDISQYTEPEISKMELVADESAATIPEYPVTMQDMIDAIKYAMETQKASLFVISEGAGDISLEDPVLIQVIENNPLLAEKLASLETDERGTFDINKLGIVDFLAAALEMDDELNLKLGKLLHIEEPGFSVRGVEESYIDTAVTQESIDLAARVITSPGHRQTAIDGGGICVAADTTAASVDDIKRTMAARPIPSGEVDLLVSGTVSHDELKAANVLGVAEEARKTQEVASVIKVFPEPAGFSFVAAVNALNSQVISARSMQRASICVIPRSDADEIISRYAKQDRSAISNLDTYARNRTSGRIIPITSGMNHDLETVIGMIYDAFLENGFVNLVISGDFKIRANDELLDLLVKSDPIFEFLVNSAKTDDQGNLIFGTNLAHLLIRALKSKVVVSEIGLGEDQRITSVRRNIIGRSLNLLPGEQLDVLGTVTQGNSLTDI